MYAKHRDAAGIRFTGSSCALVFMAGCKPNKLCNLEFQARQSIDGCATCH